MHDPEPADGPPPAAVIETLVANHHDFLRFLESRVGSRAEAEDILQDAFVKSAVVDATRPSPRA